MTVTTPIPSLARILCHSYRLSLSSLSSLSGFVSTSHRQCHEISTPLSKLSKNEDLLIRSEKKWSFESLRPLFSYRCRRRYHHTRSQIAVTEETELQRIKFHFGVTLTIFMCADIMLMFDTSQTKESKHCIFCKDHIFCFGPSSSVHHHYRVWYCFYEPSSFQEHSLWWQSSGLWRPVSLCEYACSRAKIECVEMDDETSTTRFRRPSPSNGSDVTLCHLGNESENISQKFFFYLCINTNVQ